MGNFGKKQGGKKGSKNNKQHHNKEKRPEADHTKASNESMDTSELCLYDPVIAVENRKAAEAASGSQRKSDTKRGSANESRQNPRARKAPQPQPPRGQKHKYYTRRARRNARMQSYMFDQDSADDSDCDEGIGLIDILHLMSAASMARRMNQNFCACNDSDDEEPASTCVITEL